MNISSTLGLGLSAATAGTVIAIGSSVMQDGIDRPDGKKDRGVTQLIGGGIAAGAGTLIMLNGADRFGNLATGGGVAGVAKFAGAAAVALGAGYLVTVGLED